jgi:hypothetical protein
LQRVHNEKSLKPLPQIDFTDLNGTLFVRIQNNGVGPFIIENLIFSKGKQTYYRIQDCLELDPKSYVFIDIDITNKKIIFPGAYLEIFFKQFEQHQELDIDLFRRQLANLTVKVEGRDIYNNKTIVEKSLKWFSRQF